MVGSEIANKCYRSGVPLPRNFENVPLGRKEIQQVQAVYPDYDG